MTRLCFSRHFKSLALAALVAGAILSPGSAGAGQSRIKKAGQNGTLASVWSVPKPGGAAWLVQPGSARLTRVAIEGDTAVTGTCRRSHQRLSFKAADASQACRLCDAAASQGACLAGKPLSPTSVEALLRALPAGTGLRVTYNVAGEPGSGLRSLAIDRHSVLLSVGGLQHLTPAQLKALVKPLGAEHVALLAENKQLFIVLKQEWTGELAAQLRKRLERVGGSFAYTTPACCKLSAA